MPLLAKSARISYCGPARLNVTRKSGSDQGLAFAPSWEILSPVLEMRRATARLSPDDPEVVAALERVWSTYKQRYLDEMRESYRTQRDAWAWLLARERVVLVCYCHDPERCHRTVLRAEILPRLGAFDGGEVDATMEPHNFRIGVRPTPRQWKL